MPGQVVSGGTWQLVPPVVGRCPRMGWEQRLERNKTIRKRRPCFPVNWNNSSQNLQQAFHFYTVERKKEDEKELLVPSWKLITQLFGRKLHSLFQPLWNSWWATSGAQSHLRQTLLWLQSIFTTRCISLPMIEKLEKISELATISWH